MVDYVLVPVEPTEEQWSGLARQIILWRGFSRPTGANLHKHLRDAGWQIPDWLPAAIPDTDHVPPKGSVAVAVYRAMLAARPAAPVVGEDEIARALADAQFWPGAFDKMPEAEQNHFRHLARPALVAPPAETPTWEENYKNAWAGLSMIREAIETLGPPGCVASEEAVVGARGPEPLHEAEELVEGVKRLYEAGYAAALNDALKRITPSEKPPCECMGNCDCGNSGDLASMWSWMADNASCETLRSLLPPTPPAETWRPIETAPHGVLVLLGWRNHHTGEWEQEVGPASWGHTTETGFSNRSLHGSATHWLPLPPAPPATQREG